MKQAGCQLCGRDAILSQSHIVPAFVFQWMKRTGGKLRWATQPNRPIQDGPKLPLLCQTCEQRLSGREAWFSQHLFRPAVENRLTFPLAYDQSLFYFLISLAWRVVCFPNKKIPEDADQLALALEAVRQRWARYLLSGIGTSIDDTVHLMICADGFSLEGSGGPRRLPSEFLLRRVDASIVSAHGRCLVYIKLPRFIALASVTPFEENKFVNTRVYSTGGELRVPQYIGDDWIGSILVDRARLEIKTNQKQWRKDLEWLRQNRTSDLANTLRMDLRAFGCTGAIWEKMILPSDASSPIDPDKRPD